MMDIKIDYNGKYPTLCSGNLKVTVDGKLWQFPPFCLYSGGGVWFDFGNERNEHVKYGEWTICDWPENFPEKLKDVVMKKINAEIPYGCCGGCI